MANFKNSPLAQFVTEPTEKKEKETRPRKRTAADRARIAAENAQYKNPAQWNNRAAMDNAEPRTRRVQLLMKPSVYSALYDIATVKGQSINNLVEAALLQFIEDNKQ